MKTFVAILLSILLIFSTAPLYARGGGHGGGGHGGGGHSSGSFSSHGYSGGYTGGRYSGVSHGAYSTGGYHGGYTSGYHGSYVTGHYYGGHYYSGGYYGGYPRYYYGGWAPYGAAFGFFLGGVVVGGIYSPFWYPYYYEPVPSGYYDPYYQYSYPAPGYVVEVPPPEATTQYQQQSTGPVPPNQCYAPKMDQSGNMLKENGNPIPDFGKPVPCPAQQ